MTPSNFEHKGVAITLTGTAEFTATVRGVFVRKQSLSAMKKHIDKALADKFESFDALVLPDSWRLGDRKKDKDGFVKLHIIGLTKTLRGGYRPSEFKFVIEGNQFGDYQPKMFVDTPENREAYAAAKAYETETAAIEKVRKGVQKELDEKIKQYKPDDMARKLGLL